MYKVVQLFILNENIVWIVYCKINNLEDKGDLG